MRGGREFRTFFLRQASEFIKRHTDQLPDSEYSSEEEEAGFRKFNEVFNFYATLQILTGWDLTKQSTILKMPTNEVYFNILCRAWHGHYQKAYHEIMIREAERKAKKK